MLASNDVVKDRPSLIKSKDRVRDMGEVFTPDFLVEQMLDQFPRDAWDKDSNWLEPTCGNGQFILGILRRKIQYGHRLLEALDTTFGCDIMPDNIRECHIRIYREIVMPYVRAKKVSDKTWKSMRIKIACLVDHNIRRTKDALQEDFTKWMHFADLPESRKQSAKARIERIFGLIDSGEPVKLTNAYDRRLLKELSALTREYGK